MVQTETRHQLTENIPMHLRLHLATQDYSLYTPIDHAVWRFIMRVAKPFFAEHAHEKYLSGLRETGISTERVPRIEEMDEKLRRFNWRAVPVVGFIPPAAFLEFQSYGLLPIACDIRKLENITYTPAPDIVHEAAGHSPIIADSAYSDYLRSYGEVARRAIFSKENMNVYYAVRHLSDIKENPRATKAEIDEAEKRVQQRLSEMQYESEVDWVSRLGWWTIEYGLIGDLDAPKIYGAGLLSSIGESFHCITPKVKKIPLSIDCIHTNFNITEPQPQLFVTPNFEFLSEVLEQLADMMAFRRGGLVGLQVAKRGETVCTVELDSGLQISGIVTDFRRCHKGKAAFLKFDGPVQLAYRDEQLAGHDPSYHHHGYSTPLGQLKAPTKSPADLTPAELELLGFKGDAKGRMEFESGITLEGVLTSKLERDGKNLVLTFTNCTVKDGDAVLFDPEWGTFDLGCGDRIPTVFGGAADRWNYLVATGQAVQDESQHTTNLTDDNRILNTLYEKVRDIRESGAVASKTAELADVLRQLDEQYPNDWLLRFELLELDHVHALESPWKSAVREKLQALKSLRDDTAENIERGLALLD